MTFCPLQDDVQPLFLRFDVGCVIFGGGGVIWYDYASIFVQCKRLGELLEDQKCFMLCISMIYVEKVRSCIV